MLVLPLLAAIASFEPSGGVPLSCLENVRGKEGRARVEVVVGAGAMQETEAERGVAHLLEHLVLRPLGFDDGNGATGWTYTSYHRDVRAQELLSAARSLLEELQKPEITREDVEVEKRIVLRELEDRGTSHAERQRDPLFEGTPLARYPGGSARAVSRLDAEDVRRFHARYYVAANMAVLLRGAVDCDAARAELEPVLSRFSTGERATRPRVEDVEPGRIGLPGGAGAFVSGFYWYDSTPEEEVLYQLLAKHFEQSALQDLRKNRGLTYSPSGQFVRRGRGGQIALTVRTESAESEVAQWYEETLGHLRRSQQPRTFLTKTFEPVRQQLERDGVRAGLAAIWAEPDPLSVLEGLSDADIVALLPKLMSDERAFGSALPQSNVASLMVLGLFGMLVLAALYFAFRAFIGRR